MIDLKRLKQIAQDATPGPWGPMNANYPFYVDMEKPAPSLSKHDQDRPTYWRYQDAIYVLSFNPVVVIELIEKIEELEAKLNG
jgi:hypothetical protein